jgi:hypothetical protein
MTATPAKLSAALSCPANRAPEASADAPLDRWLERHAGLVMLVVLAAGFLLRLRAAAHNYLSPDEALIYLVANQPSLRAVYKASLHEAHPPLSYFLLHSCLLLGHSELILRLPSVLAGSILPWFAYKWLKTVFGARTAWIGMLLFAFSPAMITQSIQDRQYALLLLLLAAALYFLEAALGEDSVSKMALFSLFLLLALATHYSTPWFAIALGVYAFGRILHNPPSRAVTRTWVGCMAGAAALIQFFFVTHVAKLRTSGLMAWMVKTSWLHELYFHPGKTSVAKFVLLHSIWFFQFLFGQEAIGFAMCAVFLIAASLLLDPRLRLPGKATPRLLALLILLPFLIAIEAGLAQLYPYGPAREDLWLAPFAIAGVSYGLGQLGGRRRAWPALGLASIVVFSGLATASKGVRLSPDLSRKVFEEPIRYIHQSVPQNQPILTDLSTILTLGYYLCGDRGFPDAVTQGEFSEYRCGGYRFLLFPRQTFTPANFPYELERARKTFGLAAGEWLWVAHTGFGDQLQEKLTGSFPELLLRPRKTSLNGVSIFQVAIPRPSGTGK